jgi:hypothetical protein
MVEKRAEVSESVLWRGKRSIENKIYCVILMKHLLFKMVFSININFQSKINLCTRNAIKNMNKEIGTINRVLMMR